jgi:hypothetical protein
MGGPAQNRWPRLRAADGDRVAVQEQTIKKIAKKKAGRQ